MAPTSSRGGRVLQVCPAAETPFSLPVSSLPPSLTHSLALTRSLRGSLSHSLARFTWLEVGPAAQTRVGVLAEECFLVESVPLPFLTERECEGWRDHVRKREEGLAGRQIP